MTLEHGFVLLEEREIPEIKTRAYLYRHVNTGAQLLSLVNQDENKVFGITFRTPPEDSTGIAHIMEHAVLCGSHKYPVKEPFVELVKGSLNTYLNAFTYPDKTCYPVASQNLQDFYNLIDVYLDAVLHPLIPPHTLQQEGWHYELESLDAPLSYKGVVFNEMKGAYSNPDDLLSDRVRQSLYPDTPYAVVSGGDPRHIPELTYQQFKAFHEKFYHPSNARIYFYGDDDPAERLRLLDDYLSAYSAIKVDSAIPLQPKFTQPHRSIEYFDPGDDPNSDKGRLVMNWLLVEVGDPEILLGLAILEHILLGTPASPLRKALIDSGLGEDLAGVGLETELRQAYFSTGLKGLAVKADHSLAEGETVESLVLQTLESLAQDGIDPEMIAASMNTIEFRLRENNTGSFPRGLLLMLRALNTWLYDQDPLAALAFEAPLGAIKARLAAGEPYFERLIQTYFLNNPHRTTLVLQPQPGLNQIEEAAEKERLDLARQRMTVDDLQQIIDESRRLKQLQETPDTLEALATIPSLKLEDLERQNKHIPLAIAEHLGCPVLFHDLFTNGIAYLDLGLDLHTLPQDLLPYVPLFGRALLEMGTEKEDFVRLSQRIGRTTGGIRPVTYTTAVHGQDQSAAWLFLRGKATVAQIGELLSILKDVLLTVRLDNPERFRQIVLEDKADKESMLVPAGHRVINTRLRAQFHEADWAEEQMHGVDSLFFIRNLAQAMDQDWPSVLAKLESIRQILLNRQAMLCNVTLDSSSWEGFQPQLENFLSTLPSANPARIAWQPAQAAPFEGLAIPAHVNYVGKGANLYDLGYTPHGSVEVITNYLRTTWLWERVRVRGGAYGAFCVFNHRSGIFTYLSYRDPNLLTTLENYESSAAFLHNLDLDPAELTKSIIGAIGEMDAYQLPDAKGYTSMARYLAGDTEDRRQHYREQILTTSLADFWAFGEVLARLNENNRVVVLGSQEAIDQANQERGEWLEVKKLL
jgi:hypothetical protein